MSKMQLFIDSSWRKHIINTNWVEKTNVAFGLATDGNWFAKISDQ